MNIPRIYQSCSLLPGEQTVLGTDATHHLLNVLRVKPGESIAVFNGTGGYYDAAIVEIGKHRIVVEIREFHPDDFESTLHLTLAQGISRGQKMDMTLQKSVELGVDTIIPVQSQYCSTRLKGEQLKKRMAHWQKILIAACEQCGRNRLPALQEPVDFSEYVSARQDHLKIILNPYSSAGLTGLMMDSDRVIVMTGPEGGFSQEEISLSEQFGYHGVSLGPRILRTETAAIAAITTCQVLWGDFR